MGNFHKILIRKVFWTWVTLRIHANVYFHNFIKCAWSCWANIIVALEKRRLDKRYTHRETFSFFCIYYVIPFCSKHILKTIWSDAWKRVTEWARATIYVCVRWDLFVFVYSNTFSIHFSFQTDVSVYTKFYLIELTWFCTWICDFYYSVIPFFAEIKHSKFKNSIG